MPTFPSYFLHYVTVSFSFCLLLSTSSLYYSFLWYFSLSFHCLPTRISHLFSSFFPSFLPFFLFYSLVLFNSSFLSLLPFFSCSLTVTALFSFLPSFLFHSSAIPSPRSLPYFPPPSLFYVYFRPTFPLSDKKRQRRDGEQLSSLLSVLPFLPSIFSFLVLTSFPR